LYNTLRIGGGGGGDGGGGGGGGDGGGGGGGGDDDDDDDNNNNNNAIAGLKTYISIYKTSIICTLQSIKTILQRVYLCCDPLLALAVSAFDQCYVALTGQDKY